MLQCVFQLAALISRFEVLGSILVMKVNQSFSYHFSMASYELSVPSRLAILIQIHAYVRLIYLISAYMHMCICTYMHIHRYTCTESGGRLSWPVECSLTFFTS